MKTTLWSREQVANARPFLERIERDLALALERADNAIDTVRRRKAAFERAKPKMAAPCWVDLVRAQDELNDALDGLGVLAAEVRSLNGRLALDRGASIDVAGEAEGVPVFWSLADGSLEAEPVFRLEAVAA